MRYDSEIVIEYQVGFFFRARCRADRWSDLATAIRFGRRARAGRTRIRARLQQGR